MNQGARIATSRVPSHPNSAASRCPAKSLADNQLDESDSEVPGPLRFWEA